MKKKTQTKWNSAALGLGSCWKKELHQERATAADQFVERQGRTTAVKIPKKNEGHCGHDYFNNKGMGTSKLGFWFLLLCNLFALPSAACDTTPSSF